MQSWLIKDSFISKLILIKKKVQNWTVHHLKPNANLQKKKYKNTRRIASARIHMERKMEQIKKFRLLQGIIPLTLAPIANELFFVCAALTNLLPPLVNQWTIYMNWNYNFVCYVVQLRLQSFPQKCLDLLCYF